MPNKTLRVLFLYNGFFVLASSLLGPLYALYVTQFTTSVSSSNVIMPVSLSWAVFLFSTTIFTYAISKVGDRSKHKRYYLAGGYLIRAVCWLAMVFVTSITQLIILQFVLGIGEALGTPAFDAIFAEHLDKNKHIMDYSDWKIMSNGTLVIGTLLGGYIVSSFGFSYLFIIMSALAFVSFGGILLNRCVDIDNTAI